MSDPHDPRRLLETLARHRVDFVVIGGVAVQAHGHPRTTQDLDVVPAPDTANLERLAAALDELGVEPTAIDGELQTIDPSDPADLARSRNLKLHTAAGRIDLMNRALGSPPYDDLAARALRIRLGELEVAVAGLNDLIAMKHATGREQDLRDIAALSEPLG